MTLNGIDIASHQQGINVAAVPSDFVIIKGTGGKGYVNPWCDSRFQMAKKAGKLLGVYHYAHEIGYQGTAKEEAAYFVKNCANYLKGDAIPILDWESDNTHDVAWALTWLQEVERLTGIKPWFYTYSYLVNSINFGPIARGNYGLWIANYYHCDAYGRQLPFTGYQKPNPPHSNNFGTTACYQYSSMTHLAGYGGGLDASVFYGDAKAWKAYATPRGKQPTIPKPSTPAPKPNSYSVAGKSLETLATDTVNKKTGQGKAREALLGKYYTGVQAIINQRMGIISADKAVSILKAEVMKDIYGKGDERKRLLGTYWKPVQASINGIKQAPKTRYYTVRAGDSLSVIGGRLGIPWTTLASKNGLKSPYTIYAGQKLKY